MLPLRLVLDTNQLVSATLKPGTAPRTALNLACSKPARLYVTEAILSEYANVLMRPELDISRGRRLQTLQLIRNAAHIVKPSKRIYACSDEDDNIFLECADAARADYLITGNLRHFPAFWKATKIITARQFIEIVTPHLHR